MIRNQFIFTYCLLFLCFWAWIGNCAQAQGGYRIQRLSAETGLANVAISALCEDAEGFVWVGTENGLYRYDGYYSELYGYGQPYPNNLEANKVLTIAAGPRNIGVLAATAKGLNLINRDRNQNTNINVISHSKAGYPNFAIYHSVWWPSAQAFVLTGEQYICLYFPKTNSFRNVARKPAEAIQSIALKDQQVQLSTSANCEKLTLEKSVVRLSISHALGMLELEKHTVGWARNRITGIGIFQDSESNTSVQLSLPANVPVLKCFTDGAATWLGFPEDGITILQPNGVAVKLSYSSKDEESLPSNNISALLTCRQGVVLIGTDYGLCKYDPKQSHITYHHNPATTFSDSRYTVNSIYEEQNGLIYTATNNGLDVFQTDGKFLVSEKHIGDEMMSALGGGINSIASYQSKLLFLGSNQGLVFWNNETHQPVKIFKNAVVNGVSVPFAVNCLLLQNDTCLWIGTKNSGLLCFNPIKNSFKAYTKNSAATNSLASNTITTLALSSKNELWVGTTAGLHLFKEKHQDFLPIDCFVELEQALVSNYITAIYPADNGVIWIGTKGGGLVSYNWYGSTHTAKNWLQLAGTPIANISAIIPEGNQHLWIASQGNLINMHQMTHQAEAFGYGDGQKLPMLISGMGNLPSGKIIMAGESGFIQFKSKELLTNHNSIDAYFTSIEVNGQKLGSPKQITLTHETENITFHVSAISLSEGYKSRFRYKLNANGNWIELPSGTRSIVLNNLLSGNYTLYIQAKLPGTAFGAICKYDFAIPAAWYELWYIRLLALTLVVAVVVLVFRIRLAYLRNQLKVSQLESEAALKTSTFERKALELQLQALSAQMNPHFVFNCLNAIQECIVNGENSTAQTYLSRFAKLLRLVLENQQHSAISLQDELATLEIYLKLEQLRFANDFSWNIIFDQDVDTEEIILPPLLLQPFVENAVWHGLRRKPGSKQLVIYCYLKSGWVYIMIADNGIGRKNAIPNPDKKSLGLSITQQRIDLFIKADNSFQNTWIIDRDEEHLQGQGTTVILILPEDISQVNNLTIDNSEIETTFQYLTQIPLW